MDRQEGVSSHVGINLRKESDDYGRKIRDFRANVLDMTQDDFAAMMGVSVSTLRNWEQGTSAAPKYFVRALSVMALDPGRAMTSLGTFMGIEEGAGHRWDGHDEAQSSMSGHARAMAVERMKASKDRSRAMDIVDEIMSFREDMDALGDRYRDRSSTDLLLLYQIVLMERLNNNLEELVESR